MADNETRGRGLAPATAGDYRELARRRLPRQLFDFLDGAAYDELTAGESGAHRQEEVLLERQLPDLALDQWDIESARRQRRVDGECHPPFP